MCFFNTAYKIQNAYFSTELDALALEEEEEGISYLADLNKAPDFVDEPPVAVEEVCSFPSGIDRMLLITYSA